MTAHAMNSHRERCLSAGMDGYLSKPIDGRELIGLVEKLGVGDEGGAESFRSASPAGPTHPVFDRDEAIRSCYGREQALR